jgi:tetratricopeptide (TPR) repeat protein
MKKSILSALFIAAVSFSAYADNNKAIGYFKFGLNNAAQKMLLEELNSGKQTPREQAETYFYLGEIAFAEQDKAAAAENYNKGAAADPTYIFNKIGQAKLLLSTNAAQAEKDMAAILINNPKDMALQCAVAKAYLDNNMLDKTLKQIAEAKKVNDKYAPLYVLEGDLRWQEFRQTGSQTKAGDAANLYERAIYFDNQCKEAYAKYARIFTLLNPGVAIAKLQELMAIDPSSPLVHREMGEVYFQSKQYANAAEAYAKYIDNDKYSVSDFYNYAIILFYKDDHEKSLEIVNKALAVDPNNVRLQRYFFYNNAKLKHPEAITYAEDFMNTPDQNFISTDFIYYAQLLKEQKREQEAVVQYEKALQIDGNNALIYKELGGVYFALKQYDKAIENYTLFIQKGEKQVTGADHIFLGLSYYNAAADEQDAVKKENLCIAGDSVFASVIEMAPNSYFGHFWRARMQTLLDPSREKGLAQPYYEAAVELLSKDPTKYIKEQIECYDYLGYYYMLLHEKSKDNNDLKTSKSYWQKIIELDPENATAKKVLKGMQGL